MNNIVKYGKFSGKMLLVGCGSIGQGVLPLIIRHLDMKARQITIVAADERKFENNLVPLF